MQTEGVHSSRARSYFGWISVEWWPKTAAIVVGDRSTPLGRSSRDGWRGRSRPSSNHGRSVDAWANTAVIDQCGGTTIAAGVETFSRARSFSNSNSLANVETPCNQAESSSNNIPNLSSEKWSKLLTVINNTDVTQSDKLSSMKNLWILDSGFSHHMTSRKDFVSNFNIVYPYTIGQPNGTKEEPATKTALLQAIDLPGPASRADHHDHPSTHSPTASIPINSEPQRAQPNTYGPADSLPADSAAQHLHSSGPASVSIHPIQQASWTRTFPLHLVQWLQIQQQ
ncbi:hypothetical protein M9H77_28140 [Catharanthus roseus]|uniref:Uncharacterized protein n=1 Tax=Catharanthus roseus TaxID=4058 RepID=A0ACC0AFY0_CATRO|nr:hypothetical protein M9H77_28140 [Catharanthus roseus]